MTNRSTEPTSTKVTPIFLQGVGLQRVDLPEGIQSRSLSGTTASVGMDPIEEGKRALVQAAKEGNSVAMVINAHGRPNQETGAHEMDIGGGKSSAALLREIVGVYRDAYQTAHPNQEIPKLRIGITSCYSEGILKDLSKQDFKGMDLFYGDSEQKLIWNNDLEKIFVNEVLTNTKPAEAVYVDILKKSQNSEIDVNKAYIPGLAIALDNGDVGALDGATLRNKGPQNHAEFNAYKQGALKQLTELGNDDINSVLDPLTSETRVHGQYPQSFALLGYAGDFKNRFTPHEKYIETGEPIRAFLRAQGATESPEAQKERLDTALNQLNEMDPNIVKNMLPYALRGTREYLLPRYQALVDKDVNILGDAAARKALHIALEVTPENKRSEWINTKGADQKWIVDTVLQNQDMEGLKAALPHVVGFNYPDGFRLTVASLLTGPDFLKEVLQAGGNPNEKLLEKQYTPLHLAVMESDETKGATLVNLLLADSRTDPNLKDLDGRTALHHAFESLEMIKCLVKDPRVDLQIENREGKTTADIFKEALKSSSSGVGREDLESSLQIIEEEIYRRHILSAAGKKGGLSSLDRDGNGEVTSQEIESFIDSTAGKKSSPFNHKAADALASQLRDLPRSVNDKTISSKLLLDFNENGKNDPVEIAMALMAAGVRGHPDVAINPTDLGQQLIQGKARMQGMGRQNDGRQ